MIQIQTKQPILYNTRDYKFAKIKVQLELSQTDSGYNAVITDFAEVKIITETTGEPIESTISTLINRKNIFISEPQINYLFGMVDNVIPKEIPFFEREILLRQNAFLTYVQNDFIKDENGDLVTGKTIYNLNPSDWEIIN